MSAPQSRLKERSLPLGGTARSAKGAHIPAGPPQGANGAPSGGSAPAALTNAAASEGVHNTANTASYRRNDIRAHGHPAFWAFVVHRVSGLTLTLFLPLHFWALGMLLEEAPAFDAFLSWTRAPLAKLAETLLVLALAVHLAGGLRLLFVEFVGWRAETQKTFFALGAGAAIACALAFALNAR